MIMNRKSIASASAVILVVAMSGCASYTVRPTPKLNPTAYADHVHVQGVYVAAKAYTTAKACKSVFSDNLAGNGYIPVQVSLENKNQSPLLVYRSNMSLVLPNGQKLDPVPASVMVQRFQNSVVGGALLTGVFGVAAAEDANHKRAATFKQKELAAEIPLAPGQLQTGFLYFKVKPTEVKGGSLSISFTLNGKQASVKVPLA